MRHFLRLLTHVVLLAGIPSSEPAQEADIGLYLSQTHGLRVTEWVSRPDHRVDGHDEPGGSIAVKSEPNRGSMFTVKLPFRQARPESRPLIEALHTAGELEAQVLTEVIFDQPASSREST